jgi:hypothetical protein
MLKDIAENKSPELSPKDIVSIHVTESVQNLIGNLRDGGRKRTTGVSRKKAKRAYVIKKGTSSHDFLQSFVNMSEVTSISSQFDTFMHRPIQTAVQGTVERVYKPLAPVEQNDLEFLIPGSQIPISI